MQIHYLRQEEIDRVKWNSCVHYAQNGNIFGYKWFLDHVAKDWDALVEGDYESVMPLVWRKHWAGGRTLYQPVFMRELGIYSIHVLSKPRIQAFLEAIPSDIKSIEMDVNESMVLDEAFLETMPDLKSSGFHFTDAGVNFQLLLQPDYDQLEQAYSPQLQETLAKATAANLMPGNGIKPETLADFYKKHHPVRRDIDQRFHALQRIIYNVLHRGWGYAVSISDEKGELLAADFVIISHSKLTSLAACESPAGKAKGALAMLFDLLIRSNASKPLILDFNGNPGAWGSAFGATQTEFSTLHKRSQMPLPSFFGRR